MLTEPNTRLVTVRFQPRYDEGDVLSHRGEPNWEEVDLLALYPRWRMVTWVDWQVQRRAAARGFAVDIDAVWEVKQWIIDKIEELTSPSRVLQIGDLVQFDFSETWFAILSKDLDSGIFKSIPMWRMNLKKSLKNRGSCT